MVEVKDINTFLQKTDFCDISNRNIVSLSNRISQKYNSDREKAVALFYWVRDNIRYRVGLWHRAASRTLAEREGTCTNSANLLVALLRAINIPAGYGIMKVDGRRYFGPIGLPILSKFAGKISTHVYALVYLDNQWIKCDPSDDIELCDSSSHYNYSTKPVDWDGTKDAVLELEKSHIFSDEFPIASIDPWMRKRSKYTKSTAIRVANMYLQFVREHPEKFSNVEQLERVFIHWLKVNHKFIFSRFILASTIRNIHILIKE